MVNWLLELLKRGLQLMFKIIKNAVCWNLVPGLKFVDVCYSGESVAQFGIDEYGRLWSWGNNNFGIGGLGNWEWQRPPANVIHNRDNERVLRPRLCESREVVGESKFIKTDFVQVQSGEGSSMALDSSGRLWCAGQAQWGGEVIDHNCAVFGLPHDSGEDDQEWTTGISRDNWQYYFFHFTRAVPDMLVKDYMHNSYYTLLIGPDDRVYYLGRNDTNGISGQASGFSASEPAAITQLNFAVKKLFHNGCFNFAMAGCVTEDNRVIVWGDHVSDLVWSWDETHDIETNNFIDITQGLPAEDIVELSISYNGFMVTLANGEVWRADYFNEDYPVVWEQWDIPLMQWFRYSQGAWYGLDLNGYLWSYRADYGTLVTDPSYVFTPTQADTRYRFNTLRYNRYNVCWQGIDQYGRLMAWGSQSWGPHLGNGTIGNLAWLASSYSGLTQEVAGEQMISYFPQQCDYPGKEADLIWTNQRPFHAAVSRIYER